MKEERFFYCPDIKSNTLPDDEAKHAVRVLRLQAGDEIFLIDGCGAFHRAEITLASNKHCNYQILETMPQEREWKGYIHLAMAPTKMMERTEWFAEKATEIGIDEFSFLNCRLSERRQLRLDRIENKVLSAVKQSRKAWMPKVNEMLDFKDFILNEEQKQKETAADTLLCIAHCYDDIPRRELFPLLSEKLSRDPADPQLINTVIESTDNLTESMTNITILIGPEGDFHRDEVLFALNHNFHSISLGTSRLRTETAALAAVMTARLSLT